MPDMNAVKISTAKGTARVESATIRAGDRLEQADLEVDGVEAHRHDDAGDHLGGQQDEVEDAAAARAQPGQRVTGGADRATDRTTVP